MRPQVACEIAFGKAPTDAVAEADWTDVSDRLRSARSGELIVETIRGRLDPMRQPRIGTARLWLDNIDGQLDPRNEASQWHPDVAPMTPVRLTITLEDTAYPLWRGFVERWPTVRDLATDAYVAAQLVDGREWLAHRDVHLDRPAETTGERIGALLDAAGWPAELRDLDDGVVAMLAREQPEVNALDEIDAAATAEDGVFFFAADGTATFRDRHDALTNDPPTPQLVIGSGAGEHDVRKLRVDRDTAWVTNRARVERSDGLVFAYEDADSTSRFGQRDTPAMDIDVPGAEAEGWAMWRVVRFGLPVDRVEDLPVGPQSSVAAMTAAASIDVGDLVELAEVGELMRVEHVRHDLDGDRWQTRWALSPYFGEDDWLILTDENDEPSDAPVLGDESGDTVGDDPVGVLAP